MSARHLVTSREVLLANVIVTAPDEWSTPECAAALMGVMDAALTAGLKYGDDWSAVWPADAAGWERLRLATPEGTHVPRSPRTDPQLARALFDACQALTYGTVADGPMPPNEWCVTRTETGVTFFAGGAKHASKESALYLAVWLIALADPTLSDAVPMLLRVATR